METTEIYLIPYHSYQPDSRINAAFGRFACVEKAIAAGEWPYDNGDDPSFFAARRDHGLLTWGETLEEAFMWLWLLQRACDIQVTAAAVGRLRPVAKSVLTQTRLEGAGDQAKVCNAAFDALVRKIDAVDDSYRN